MMIYFNEGHKSFYLEKDSPFSGVERIIESNLKRHRQFGA
jgi:hypothetical protein